MWHLPGPGDASWTRQDPEARMESSFSRRLRGVSPAMMADSRSHSWVARLSPGPCHPPGCRDLGERKEDGSVAAGDTPSQQAKRPPCEREKRSASSGGREDSGQARPAGSWVPRCFAKPRSVSFVVQSQMHSRQTEHAEAFPNPSRSFFRGGAGGRVPHKRSDWDCKGLSERPIIRAMQINNYFALKGYKTFFS